MSFAEVARPLRGLIPCSLVGEAAWEELLEVVSELPACVANHDVGFEVRLGSSCPVVDFGFAVCAGSSLAEALSAPSTLVPEGHARACGRYLRAEVPLLASLLFEYDLTHGRRVPALFAVPPGGGLFGSPGVPLGVLGLARPGLSVCQRRRLAGFFGSGSNGAVGLSSVGLFSGRRLVCLRLSTFASSPEELGVAARSLGWCGDTQWVMRALGRLPGRFQYQAGVDLLPDGTLGEWLGVELHAARPGASWIDGGWGVSHPLVWRPVLEALVALGLCVPEKAEALVDFHGRWRVETAYGACLVGGGLSHLKLVFSGETVSAKAYPTFGLPEGWLGVGATSLARRGVRG